MQRRLILAICLSLAAASDAPHKGTSITRDVVIIGGGQSGTYAAINLREMGKSVIVIEKEDVLGGHVNTYTDPSTGLTVDYGVQGFINNSATLDFFAHFDVTLASANPAQVSISPHDLDTGEPVSFTIDEDFGAWAQQLKKYPWLDSTWDVPRPVAADLLLPLSEFITKYNLQDIGYSLYVGAEGLSNPLEQPTVNVMKMVDPAFLSAISGAGLNTVNQDNAEIYVKARAELGEDVLLSSMVKSAARNDSGVSIVVSTPSGERSIEASKLLVTIPPVTDNMAPFALDSSESTLFNQFKYMGYYTLLINNTGLSMDFEIINANSSEATYHIPELPAVASINPTRISGLFYAWCRSPNLLSQEQVEETVIQTVQRLQSAEGLPHTIPNIVEYRSHSPYKLYVPSDKINDGFYAQLYGLQGHRSTYYTGAALISHNCGLIFEFTRKLLPTLFP